MAIEIKEFVGYAHVFTNDKKPLNVKESAVPAIIPQMVSPNSLMVDIEGIHSVLTVNYNLYEDSCLIKSIPRWTEPYERPVIMHHNEEDGVIIGRVKKAAFIEKSERSKSGGLLFTCNIGDPKGVEGVNNGTLATVSIGAIVYDVRCSICGKNLAETGECEHKKGMYYKDELCYWIIKDMEPKEISYVIVPSDKYAHNVRVYKPNPKNFKESVEVNKMSICEEIMKGVVEVKESANVKEAAIIEEEVKDDVVGKNPEHKEDNKEEEKPEEKEENPEGEKVAEDEKTESNPDEVKEEESEEEKKDDESNNKEEDGSNNKEEGDEEAEDEKIKKLEDKIEELEDKISNLTSKLSKVKEAKEAVDTELLQYKVKEKTQVADNIISLRESVGMPCEKAEDMIEEYSLKELTLMHKTLKESCDIKGKTVLPNKILKESLIDNDSDNTVKSVKESSNISEIDEVERELNSLLTKLTK